MANTKRKTYNAKFKSKVAIDALKEANTVAEIAYKHSVHSTLVGKWKRHALSGIPGLFTENGRLDSKDPSKKGDQRLVRELYEQVGRLKMENEWLKKKLN